MRWRMRVADLRGRGDYTNYADRLGFIFIHIPKTGGIAVSSALSTGGATHRTYRDYYYTNPHKFRRLFKFSVVRNPWDRLVSSYFFLQDGGISEQDRNWAQQNLSKYADFGDFVRGWVTEANVMSWIHFVPQHHFIVNPAGKVMVDFLIRYEALADGFAIVARRLGKGVVLPMINKSKHDHFTNYYDDETREIVRRAYARDIELFGYDFDNGETRMKNITERS